MALKITQQQVEVIRRHGAKDYPSECCGILLGHASGDDLEQLVIWAEDGPDRVALDVATGGGHTALALALWPLRRYVPERVAVGNLYLEIARAAAVPVRATAAPPASVQSTAAHARPSNYDRDHAWPWYSYVIIVVERGEPKELNSWVLGDDRSKFEAERVELQE